MSPQSSLKRGGDPENELENKTKRRKSIISKKAPTAEEMIRLKETENLFHSNLFRMQVEEVLMKIRPKKKYMNAIRSWLDKFLKELIDIPENSSVYAIDDHSWLEEMNIKYPLPPLPKSYKGGKFQFKTPSNVKCIGSTVTKCCLDSKYSVDIAITIPKDFFQKEDYLNACYHKKRALYLCYIANYLCNSKSLDQNLTKFCSYYGSPYKPILLVKPTAELIENMKVYIHVFPETETFKLSRFIPSKNNVRQKWWSEEKAEDNDLIATPIYNASIGLDLVRETNESFINTILNENSNLQDGVLLLKVWMCQRGLYESSAGLGGFLISALVSYLFKCLKLNTHMSNYQVLRNTWLFLCQTNWLTAGPKFCQDKDVGLSLREFHQHFDVVFVDVTGYINIASNLKKINYLRLKEEAQLAMKYLDNTCIHSFQSLFMTNMPFLHQYDHILRIQLKKILKTVKSIDSDKQRELDLLGDPAYIFTAIATKLLEKGLGNRVSQIAMECLPSNVWDVHADRKKCIWHSLVFGFKLNPEFALSIVEKGPEANLVEGSEFRRFWHPKSELRRFQDGTVCETVVWQDSDSPLCKRRLIAQNIVEFLIENKLKLNKKSYVYISNQLEALIVDKTLPTEAGFQEEHSLKIIQTFDSLIKQIRDITSLPLPVASVQGVSPALRYTEVFPPSAYEGISEHVGKNGHLMINQAINNITTTESIEAVIQLGISKKWPENVEAIRRIRAAFIIEIGKTLSENFGLNTQPFPDYLLVYKDGYVFKLKVVYPREIALLKEITTTQGLTAYRDTTESLKMEQNLVHLPKLSSALHGLSQECMGYGPTVCLVKRWIRSQMIDEQMFPDVPIELLVARQFVSPEPFIQTLQPQAGFIRVLNVIANWYPEPIIVNFNGELNRDDLTDIEKKFRSGLESSSLPCLFIATTYDKSGVLWTKEAPSFPLFYHTVRLAKEALAILEKNLLICDFSLFKAAFRPPLDFYHVIIHLNTLKNPRRTQGIDWEENTSKSNKSNKLRKATGTIIDLDAIQCYLHYLRNNYGDFALFFYDSFGGNIIGVIFKPSTNESKDFKVSNLAGRKPLLGSKTVKLVFDKEAVIEDFYHIGKSIVKKIERNNISSSI